MTEYCCNDCGKNFKRKDNLKQHQNKKVLCIQINNTGANCSDNVVICSNNIDEKIEIDYKNTNLSCLYCNRIFTRSSNLKRHIEGRCNIKKIHEEKQQKMEQERIEYEKLEKERQEQERIERDRLEREKLEQQRLEMEKDKQEKEQIFRLLIEKDKQIDKLVEHNHEIIKKKDETIMSLMGQIQLLASGKSNKITNNGNINNNCNNNNNNNNNTVNIQIAQFGKEDFKKIDNKHFEKIIKNPRILGLKVPEEVLKLLHFNSDYPQFSNFYVSDYNREKVMVHDGESWNLETLDAIKSVLEQIISFSREKLEEYKEKNLSDDAVKRLVRIEEAINKCDDDFIADLREMAEEENNLQILDKIRICEKFQKDTIKKIKNISYNEGKKITK
jgi:uncharacterized C2H2 Zn-finger protein